jgi:hypothetical protein
MKKSITIGLLLFARVAVCQTPADGVYRGPTIHVTGGVITSIDSLTEEDPTVPYDVKQITTADMNHWNDAYNLLNTGYPNYTVLDSWINNTWIPQGSRAAISVTTLGTGSASYNPVTGIINIPISGLPSLGTAGQLLRVNAAGTAPEYFTPSYITAAGAPVQSVFGRTGTVTANAADYSSFYKGISYTPSSLEITTALGFTPYNATNPAGYISASGAPVQSIFGRTGTVTAQAGDYGSFYEPVFSKNTAFNKNFGTAAGTVAEGNDSRIVNALSTSVAASTYQPIGTYATATNSMVFTNKTGNISMWTNDAGYLGTSGVRSSFSLTTTGNSGAATFNSTTGAWNIPQYQGQLTLTTTGSGAASLVGNTLNIPTPVTGSTTLTGAVTGTGSGTIATTLSNTGIPAGTYNTLTVGLDGRATAGFVATPANVTRALTTPFRPSTSQSVRVGYTFTHTIALTLLLGSGSTMLYLETSPDNGSGAPTGTWTLVDQAGFSETLNVAVALNRTVTNNVRADIPSNTWVRLRPAGTGGGLTSSTPNIVYNCGQETPY